MIKNLIIFIISILFLIPINVMGEEVKLSKCVDGDTAKFVFENKKEYTVRFLAIDTPEVKHPKVKEELFGKEASLFTCNSLKKANKIILEYDKNSDKYDKYNRVLAWIFVDNKLLQQELIRNGLAEVAYLYGDYKYTSLLKDEETLAKINKVGIYSEIKSKSIFDLLIDIIKEFIIKTINNFINRIVKVFEYMI
ncbi:MAG: thermonuclease family protein [Bacilli bacterium]|nr:thermonuclease family protein [Bacilli bacterium]